MRIDAAVFDRVPRGPVISLLFLLCFSVGALAQAGRITGTVTDSASETPVPNVTVAVTGTRFAGLTTSDGHFTIA
jgi:hypothetical protein